MLGTLRHTRCTHIVIPHGGPGGGSDSRYRRCADPTHWDIIQFDQRGAGRSTPAYSLQHNTTRDLVADIEQLREHLGIERWLVFGGSWGSTLALDHVQKHPEAVLGLVLRGIFLGTQREYDWLHGDGASRIWPEAHAPFRQHIPVAERGDLLKAHHRRLTSGDEAVELEAAKQWSLWEMSVSKLVPDETAAEQAEDLHFARALARIECHYFVHDCWLEDAQLMRDVGALDWIPGTSVHGRHDMVCTMEAAWRLHRAWPGSQLVVEPTSGHSMFEPGISRELVAAIEAHRDGLED